jgi:hypothetical protein
MGRASDYDNEGKTHDWYHPAEDFADGCPGGWYRCEFVRSLDPYLPTQAGQGLMESPLVGRDTPRVLIEAVQLYKRERARAEGHFFKMATQQR